MPNKRACSLRWHTPCYTPHATTSLILVISPSQSKNLLSLVKIQILEPSGWVIPKQLLHLCPYGFITFMFVSTQIWANISKMCLLDSSRSRRRWGFPNFLDLWAAPGAIWTGPQKKQVEVSGNMVHVLDIHKKRNRWPHLISLLEDSQNQ